MGRIFQHPPQKGDPISRAGIAEGLAKIDHVLTKMYVASGGSVDWALGYPRFRLSGGGGGGEANPMWAIEIDNASSSVKCTNCYLWVSGVTAGGGDRTYNLEGTSGYLMAVYDGIGDIGLEFGQLKTSFVPDRTEIYLPLYYLTKSNDIWSVALDMRQMPTLGVYL